MAGSEARMEAPGLEAGGEDVDLALLRATLGTLVDWIHVVDEELRFLYCNEALARVTSELGLAPAIPGRRLREVYHFLSDEQEHEYRRVLAEGHAIVTQEVTRVGAHSFVTETHKLPLRVGGRVTRVVTVIRDITALRTAEEARAASERRFRAVFDSATDCVFIKDRALRYTDANAAMERLFGMPESAIRGQRDDELFGPAAGAHIAAVDARVLAGETVEEEDRKPVHGRDRTFHVVKVPLRDPSGAVVGLCGIARDITERRQAEEDQRRLATRMLRAQQHESLAVLAGGVAHDFNNLLTTILGNTELALTSAGPGTSSRRQLEKVRTAARRAAELTQQLLAFAGRGDLVFQTLDLSVLAGEVANLVGTTVAKKRPIACDLAPDLPRVDGDAAQVRQLVFNLLINAAEALGDRPGTVTIRTCGVDCDVAALRESLGGEELSPGPYVALEVADTGCGISAADLPRIFEPFFSTKFTGRGLGLAAVQGIVGVMGGAIVVRSTPGHGTTVRVLFPPARAAAAVLAPGEPATVAR